MFFKFDFVTLLLIILILVFILFLFLDYRKFKKFIMNTSERERLFTDNQMEEYLNKMDLDNQILKELLEKKGIIKNESEDDF